MSKNEVTQSNVKKKPICTPITQAMSKNEAKNEEQKMKRSKAIN